MEIATTESKQTQLFITMALSAWNAQNSRVTKLIKEFSDEQWMTETAPQRNRGIYLLGHLIAVSDGLLPLFGLGSRLYPEYEQTFLKSPDKAVAQLPSLEELKKAWENVNQLLDVKFKNFSAEDWFGKHTSVSDEDFAKEPHRNKLNVLLNRTSHTANHLGQLAYLVKK